MISHDEQYHPPNQCRIDFIDIFKLHGKSLSLGWNEIAESIVVFLSKNNINSVNIFFCTTSGLSWKRATPTPFSIDRICNTQVCTRRAHHPFIPCVIAIRWDFLFLSLCSPETKESGKQRKPRHVIVTSGLILNEFHLAYYHEVGSYV